MFQVYNSSVSIYIICVLIVCPPSKIKSLLPYSPYFLIYFLHLASRISHSFLPLNHQWFLLSFLWWFLFPMTSYWRFPITSFGASSLCSLNGNLVASKLKSLRPFFWTSDSYTLIVKEQYLSLAGVVQWIECQPANHKVAGSIPSQGTCLGYEPSRQ